MQFTTYGLALWLGPQRSGDCAGCSDEQFVYLGALTDEEAIALLAAATTDPPPCNCGFCPTQGVSVATHDT